MKIKIKTTDNGYEKEFRFTNSIVLTGKENNIQTIYDRILEIGKYCESEEMCEEGQCNVYIYLEDCIKINANQYCGFGTSDYDCANTSNYLGIITKYQKIDNELYLTIESGHRYDEKMIKDFFLYDIIDTKKDKEDKIKEYEKHIFIIEYELSELKSKLEKLLLIEV